MSYTNLTTSYQQYHQSQSSDEEDSLPPSTFHPSQGGAHRYTAVSTNASRPLGQPGSVTGAVGRAKNEGATAAAAGGGGGDTTNDFIIHKVPEDHGKSRWSHMEDLDAFYRRVYRYHQEHGFKVMMLQVKSYESVVR